MAHKVQTLKYILTRRYLWAHLFFSHSTFSSSSSPECEIYKSRNLLVYDT